MIAVQKGLAWSWNSTRGLTSLTLVKCARSSRWIWLAELRSDFGGEMVEVDCAWGREPRDALRDLSICLQDTLDDAEADQEERDAYRRVIEYAMNDLGGA